MIDFCEVVKEFDKLMREGIKKGELSENPTDQEMLDYFDKLQKVGDVA